MNYMRNTQTGEIRPVEADGPEFRAMKGQVAANGVTPLWEQTSDAAATAIVKRADAGSSLETDLGAEFQGGPGAEVDTTDHDAELAPYLNLTPGERAAGLTPESKRAEVEEQLATHAPDHIAGAEAILSSDADVIAEEQAAREKLAAEEQARGEGGSTSKYPDDFEALKGLVAERGLEDKVDGQPSKAKLKAVLEADDAAHPDDDDHSQGA